MTIKILFVTFITSLLINLISYYVGFKHGRNTQQHK